MNVFAKFDEIPSKILKVIKETKCNGHTHTVGRTDNVKTVYPPTNTVCGGYNYPLIIINYHQIHTLFLLLLIIKDATKAVLVVNFFVFVKLDFICTCLTVVKIAVCCCIGVLT